MMMIWFNQPHDLAHFTPAYAFLVSNLFLSFYRVNTDPTVLGISSGENLDSVFRQKTYCVVEQMLVGVVAFNVLRVIPPEDSRALGVLLIGYFFQGTCTRPMPFLSDPFGLRPRFLYDILLHLHIRHSVGLVLRTPSPRFRSLRYVESS